MWENTSTFLKYTIPLLLRTFNTLLVREGRSQYLTKGGLYLKKISLVKQIGNIKYRLL